MKIAVVGSRGFNDYKLLKEFLDLEKITEIISGGAEGADKLAIRYARENNIPFTIFKADWSDLETKPVLVKYHPGGNAYNALAGINRNTLIVESCQKLIAFHDGNSNGTIDSLEKAAKLKKKIKIIKYLML